MKVPKAMVDQTTKPFVMGTPIRQAVTTTAKERWKEPPKPGFTTGEGGGLIYDPFKGLKPPASKAGEGEKADAAITKEFGKLYASPRVWRSGDMVRVKSMQGRVVTLKRRALKYENAWAMEEYPGVVEDSDLEPITSFQIGDRVEMRFGSGNIIATVIEVIVTGNDTYIRATNEKSHPWCQQAKFCRVVSV